MRDILLNFEDLKAVPKTKFRIHLPGRRSLFRVYLFLMYNSWFELRFVHFSRKSALFFFQEDGFEISFLEQPSELRKFGTGIIGYCDYHGTRTKWSQYPISTFRPPNRLSKGGWIYMCICICRSDLFKETVYRRLLECNAWVNTASTVSNIFLFSIIIFLFNSLSHIPKSSEVIHELFCELNLTIL